MIVVRRLHFLRVVLLSGCISSALAAGAHAAPAEPQPANPWPPIVCYVAKGEPNACGSGCSEWIAAEGTIDENAHRRLHGLLNRLGQRTLPIYFHSPGGSLEAAMAIGRMMRERAMTAGVGRTIPRGCDPLQEHESACDALKRAGRELLAELRGAARGGQVRRGSEGQRAEGLPDHAHPVDLRTPGRIEGRIEPRGLIPGSAGIDR